VNDEPLSLFDLVLGWLALIAFFTVTFCIATLRSHVDETKIRKEENISAVFRASIPPEHVLTDAGRRRVKMAKIAIAIGVATVATIVVRNQVLGR